MLINVTMPTIVGILTFISRINFMLSRVWKKFYNLGSRCFKLTPWCCSKLKSWQLICAFTVCQCTGLAVPRFLMESHSNFTERHQMPILFCLFDFLCPINNLSVKKGRVILGWTSTNLELMCLAQGHNSDAWWGSNPGPLGLKSSTLPLSHCALTNAHYCKSSFSSDQWCTPPPPPPPPPKKK